MRAARTEQSLSTRRPANQFLRQGTRCIPATGLVAERLGEFRSQADSILERLPPSAPPLLEIEKAMHGGSIYRALKSVRRLIGLEGERRA